MKPLLTRIGAWAPVLTFFALFLFFSILSGSTFLTGENLLNILRQNSALAIMAVGITFVLLIGEIDLSIENMAILSGVLTAYVFVSLQSRVAGASPFILQGVPFIAGVVAATALGAVNGVGVTRFGLPSFMMTLAMMLITEGLALRITRGSPIFDIPPVLEVVGSHSIHFFRYTARDGQQRSWIELPVITLVAAGFLAVAHVVLAYTRFGRTVYAVGGNRSAAALSGINVTRVVTVCLGICGFTAGIAGILLIGRMGSAQVGALDGMLIGCISAVVLGGTSLFGGQGGIPNTIIGVLTLGVLHNGLNHIDIDIYFKQAISGMILLGALVLNVAMARVKESEGDAP